MLSNTSMTGGWKRKVKPSLSVIFVSLLISGSAVSLNAQTSLTTESECGLTKEEARKVFDLVDWQTSQIRVLSRKLAFTDSLLTASDQSSDAISAKTTVVVTVIAIGLAAISVWIGAKAVE